MGWAMSNIRITEQQKQELVAAVNELARQNNWSPADLITIMSYETAGTLDPWKKGPPTQWGTHRGLIQWGEPQAKQYGVSKETSIWDQVMAAGKYLFDHGVKKGDGLLPMYAAINAGHASRIYASDANNGGAPGTVLDKVRDQMDDDMMIAKDLLSRYGGPPVPLEPGVKSTGQIAVPEPSPLTYLGDSFQGPSINPSTATNNGAMPLEPGVQSTGLLGIPTSAPWGVTPLNDTAYQQMLSNPSRSMQLDPGSYIEGMGGYQARGIGNNGIPEQNPMGYSTAAPAGFVQRGNLLDISPTPSPHPDIVTPIQDWTPGGMARYSNSPGTGTPAPSGTVTQGVDLASPQQSALPNFERGGLFDIAPSSYQSTPGGEQRYANGNTSPSSNLAISDPVKAAYQQMAQSAGGIQNLSGGSSIPMDYITPSNPSPIPQANPVFSNPTPTPTTGTDMASGYGQLASSMAGSGLSNLSGAGISGIPTPTPSPGYMGGSTANIDAVTSPTGVAPTYSGLTPAQQIEYDRSARNGPPGYTPNVLAPDYGQNAAATKKTGGLFGGTTSMGGIIGGLLGTAALGPIGGYLGAKLGDQIGQRITTPSMPNMGDGGGSAASQRTTRSYTTPSGRTGTVTTGPDGYRSITNEYGATTTRSPAAAAILGWD